MDRILRPSLDFLTDSDGLIAPKALSHIDHTPLAFAVALFELLAACGEGVEEWLTQAVRGLVALDQDAVGLLEAESECGS